MKYKVEITEYLHKIVEIDAENAKDALKIAEEKYDDGEYVLTADDYVDTVFGLLPSKNN